MTCSYVNPSVSARLPAGSFRTLRHVAELRSRIATACPKSRARGPNTGCRSSTSGAPVEGAGSSGDSDAPVQLSQALFQSGWFVGNLDHPERRAVLQAALDNRRGRSLNKLCFSAMVVVEEKHLAAGLERLRD